jgi:hypothetical protein
MKKITKRTKLNLADAAKALEALGYVIDFSSSVIINNETHYRVSGLGVVSAKYIQKMLINKGEQK